MNIDVEALLTEVHVLFGDKLDDFIDSDESGDNLYFTDDELKRVAKTTVDSFVDSYPNLKIRRKLQAYPEVRLTMSNYLVEAFTLFQGELLQSMREDEMTHHYETARG